VKKPPSDFELLLEIYERHRGDFGTYEEAMERRTSKIMVPINIPAIANRFGVDPDSIFGRLYYHLDPKYGEPALPDKKRHIFFFMPKAGDDENCVNFPLLEAVLAGLWQQQRRDLWAIRTALISLGIGLAALAVSITAIILS
jgi:hypothetical protein